MFLRGGIKKLSITKLSMNRTGFDQNDLLKAEGKTDATNHNTQRHVTSIGQQELLE